MSLIQPDCTLTNGPDDKYYAYFTTMKKKKKKKGGPIILSPLGSRRGTQLGKEQTHYKSPCGSRGSSAKGVLCHQKGTPETRGPGLATGQRCYSKLLPHVAWFYAC